MSIRLSDGRVIPMEMHKVRIVQKTTLPPISDRLAAIADAGYNTFLLPTRDIFLDMLTDSGTNAMSDNQLARHDGGRRRLRRLGELLPAGRGGEGCDGLRLHACRCTRAARPSTCSPRSSSSRATW